MGLIILGAVATAVGPLLAGYLVWTNDVASAESNASTGVAVAMAGVVVLFVGIIGRVVTNLRQPMHTSTATPTTFLQ